MLHAHSLYALEIRRNIKNFKPVFVDTGKKFRKILNVLQIKTKRALVWYITRPIPIIFGVPDFVWKTKTTTHPITKFLHIFEMVGTKSTGSRQALTQRFYRRKHGRHVYTKWAESVARTSLS